MSATVVEVSKAVATQLATGTYSQKVRVERRYLSLKQLASAQGDWAHEGVDTNIVVVRPATRVATAMNRDRYIQEDVGVEISLLRLASAETADEVDDLLGLLEEVCDRAREQEQAAGATWVQTIGEPMVDAEAMMQHSIFLAMATLVYRAFRR